MNLLTGPAPSPVATGGLVALVAGVAAAVAASVLVASRAAGEGASARRRVVVTAAVIAAWLAVTAALAWSGILGQFDRRPPPFLLFMAVTATLSTIVAFSRFGTLLARHAPIDALVGIQAFRLPLELVLFQLALDGVLPFQMTFDGMNYDIVTGTLAALVGLWATYRTPPRAVLVIFNLLGLFLLVVIVTIAILSAPGPLRVFPNDPANTIVTTVPFVWLPAFLVQVAWIGHLLVFRRLAYDSREAR